MERFLSGDDSVSALGSVTLGDALQEFQTGSSDTHIVFRRRLKCCFAEWDLGFSGVDEQALLGRSVAISQKGGKHSGQGGSPVLSAML